MKISKVKIIIKHDNKPIKAVNGNLPMLNGSWNISFLWTLYLDFIKERFITENTQNTAKFVIFATDSIFRKNKKEIINADETKIAFIGVLVDLLIAVKIFKSGKLWPIP